MLTKIGTQILEELNNELDTDVEDKRKQFLINDAGNTINLLFRLFVKYVHMLHFCLSAQLILILMFIDRETIDVILSTPLQDVMQFRDAVVWYSLLVSIITTAIIIFIYIANNYRSTKAQYIAENLAFMEQTKRQVELIEELMHRHQLITKKEL
ncbi:TPA: hypothetical protein P7L42_003370 [Vibrio cholerae]|uniref:hypothetical protein n=1 Tax=Vibrio cholerae TaxID=666 RepID=UPI001A32B946|nr:hypothetical protein [Vibrio cholerae]MCX9673861.1 hypothetical protein [Vibrio cholerae]MCX9680742.1 hypothetical protein [Vibrio cholerae]MCX9686885.1 hypothetical protein [Vibrio cholerae]MCX9698368.1 hypothetical protein [Vibrio cholerae]MCX9716035.1 hypothetical protein [Vibrio cholerae]